MSKIRGKVIGGTATTPINVDAFIKKSLEPGGAINEAIKNNSGVKTVTIPEGEEGNLFSLEEGFHILNGTFADYPDQPSYYKKQTLAGVLAFVKRNITEEHYYDNVFREGTVEVWLFDGFTADLTKYTFEFEQWDSDGELTVYDKKECFSMRGHEEVYLKQKTIFDDFFEYRMGDEEARQDYYPSIGTMADYVDRVVSSIAPIKSEIVDNIFTLTQNYSGGIEAKIAEDVLILSKVS